MRSTGSKEPRPIFPARGVKDILGGPKNHHSSSRLKGWQRGLALKDQGPSHIMVTGYM